MDHVDCPFGLSVGIYMSLHDELVEKVHHFAIDRWDTVSNARLVPAAEDLTLGNTGARIEVAILYADIHRSTAMVDSLSDTLAAEYYKAFLHCAAKIVRSEQGDIQAYDGDRIMAVFIGDERADQAVRAALKIAWAVSAIINPSFLAIYADQHCALQHTVGIDLGRVLVAKTGVRMASDLVWVGAAANYAAKLNSFDGLDPDFPTRITERALAHVTIRTGSNGEPLWHGPYVNVASLSHYRSNWRMSFD